MRSCTVAHIIKYVMKWIAECLVAHSLFASSPQCENKKWKRIAVNNTERVYRTRIYFSSAAVFLSIILNARARDQLKWQRKQKIYMRNYKYNIFRSIIAIFVATMAGGCYCCCFFWRYNNESAHWWTEFYIYALINWRMVGSTLLLEWESLRARI